LEGWDSTIELHSHINLSENCPNIISHLFLFVNTFCEIFLNFFKSLAKIPLLWYNVLILDHKKG
jgi:hypothetical protein